MDKRRADNTMVERRADNTMEGEQTSGCCYMSVSKYLCISVCEFIYNIGLLMVNIEFI